MADPIDETAVICFKCKEEIEDAMREFYIDDEHSEEDEETIIKSSYIDLLFEKEEE